MASRCALASVLTLILVLGLWSNADAINSNQNHAKKGDVGSINISLFGDTWLVPEYASYSPPSSDAQNINLESIKEGTAHNDGESWMGYLLKQMGKDINVNVLSMSAADVAIVDGAVDENSALAKKNNVSELRGLSEQVELYNATVADKLDPNTTVAIVSIGTNDVLYRMDTYNKSHMLWVQYYLYYTGRQLCADIESLLQGGTKNVIIVGPGPLGSYPIVRSEHTPTATAIADVVSHVLSIKQAKCVEKLINFYNGNNRKGKDEGDFDELDSGDHPKVFHIDLYNLIYKIKKHHADYGITNVSDTCVPEESNVTAKKDLLKMKETCDNPKEYLFWSEMRLSSTVHKIIAAKVYQKIKAALNSKQYNLSSSQLPNTVYYQPNHNVDPQYIRQLAPDDRMLPAPVSPTSEMYSPLNTPVPYNPYPAPYYPVQFTDIRSPLNSVSPDAINFQRLPPLVNLLGVDPDYPNLNETYGGSFVEGMNSFDPSTIQDNRILEYRDAFSWNPAATNIPPPNAVFSMSDPSSPAYYDPENINQNSHYGATFPENLRSSIKIPRGDEYVKHQMIGGLTRRKKAKPHHAASAAHVPAPASGNAAPNNAPTNSTPNDIPNNAAPNTALSGATPNNVPSNTTTTGAAPNTAPTNVAPSATPTDAAPNTVPTNATSSAAPSDVVPSSKPNQSVPGEPTPGEIPEPEADLTANVPAPVDSVLGSSAEMTPQINNAVPSTLTTASGQNQSSQAVPAVQVMPEMHTASPPVMVSEKVGSGQQKRIPTYGNSTITSKDADIIERMLDEYINSNYKARDAADLVAEPHKKEPVEGSMPDPEAAEANVTNPAEASVTNPAEASVTNPAEASVTNPAMASVTNPAMGNANTPVEAGQSGPGGMKGSMPQAQPDIKLQTDPSVSKSGTPEPPKFEALTKVSNPPHTKVRLM